MVIDYETEMRAREKMLDALPTMTESIVTIDIITVIDKDGNNVLTNDINLSGWACGSHIELLKDVQNKEK